MEATVENVKSGDYTLSRPFNIATKGEPTGVAKDFINFIMSAEGQAIVEEEGYICLLYTSISIDWARVRVLVIPTNEELMIAKDTERLVNEANH